MIVHFQMYRKWELRGRTQHLQVLRGPTTMRYTRDNHGTLRMNMERLTLCVDTCSFASQCKQSIVCMFVNRDEECDHIETIFTPRDGGALMDFDYGDKHAVMKVLHLCEHYMVTYECFDAQATFGYCPIDHEEVQIWSHGSDEISDEWKNQLKQEITDRTCVELENMVAVKVNGEARSACDTQ